MAVVHVEGFRFFPASKFVRWDQAPSGVSSLVRDTGPQAGTYSLGGTSNTDNSSSNYQPRLVAEMHDAAGSGLWSLGWHMKVHDDQNYITIDLGNYDDQIVAQGGVDLSATSATGTTPWQARNPMSIVSGQWHWYSILGNFHRTGTDGDGWAQVYVDGLLVFEKPLGSDTTPTTPSNTYVSMYLGNDFYDGANYRTRVANMVLWDTATQNMPIPPSRVDVLVPSADSTSDWTPSTGVDHYPLVADAGTEPDVDTSTYVSATGNSLDDTYTHAGGYAETSVKAVQVSAVASNTDASARTMSVLLNGAAGTATDPNANGTPEGVWETNPSGGAAWDAAAVNAATFGVRSVT